MLEELYENIPDTEKYLERIGLPGLGFDNTAETLNRIIFAHVNEIPFENLDAYAEHKVPVLGINSLYNKIILNHRGGWCHELNGLFYAFLKSFGYDVINVGVRVLSAGTAVPVGHHGIVCKIDGKEYYCDVGFGDIAFCHAVPLDGSSNAFGFHGEKSDNYVKIIRDCDRAEILGFYDYPYEPMDFQPLNYASATDPEEKFRKILCVFIMTGTTGLILIDDTIYEKKTDGSRNAIGKIHDREELKAVLKKYFKLEYGF